MKVSRHNMYFHVSLGKELLMPVLEEPTFHVYMVSETRGFPSTVMSYRHVTARILLDTKFIFGFWNNKYITKMSL